MPEINESKLREQISKNQLAPLYFLYGDEKFLVKRDILRLTKKFAAADFPEFNYNEFPHTASVDEIADAAEALPFMAERKCVTVSDLNVESLGAAELSKLHELIENVPETTVLIFFLPTLEIDVKKSAKWRNFIKKIDAAGCSLCYARRSESDLEKFLCREAEKRGCTLSRTLANRMIRYAGSDLNALTNELQKLCAFAGGGEITVLPPKNQHSGN